MMSRDWRKRAAVTMALRGSNSLARSSTVLFAAVLVALLTALVFKGSSNPGEGRRGEQAAQGQTAASGLDCDPSEGIEVGQGTFEYPASSGQPRTAVDGLRSDVVREYPRMDFGRVNQSRTGDRPSYTYTSQDGRVLAEFTVMRYGDGWRMQSFRACSSLRTLAG